MKPKVTFYVLVVLSILSILHPMTSSAQESPIYMYWVDISARKIQRANLDGTNVQDIVTGLGRPVSLDLDIVSGKIYWTDRSTPDLSDPDAMSNIQRANLDGTGIETLVSGGPSIKETIALDTSGGKMYWVDFSFDGDDNKIQRANLDGSNVEDLVTALEDPRGLALDLSRGKMYWADSGANKIQRANLDGTNIEDIVALLSEPPHYITLDFSGGKIYWTEHVDDGKIQRANLDGSNPEAVVSGLDRPFGIALDSLNGKIYWTDPIAKKIQRANLDGTNVEDLITTGLVDPLGIALGIPNNAPVFTEGDSTTRTVAENTPSGTPIGAPISATDADEDTLTYTLGGTDAAAFSIESTTGQLHTLAPLDYDTQSVYSVTVSVSDGNGGSDAITVTIHVTDSTDPPLTDVYMYWVNVTANKIQRANLDGSNVQDIATGFGRPVSLALDVSGGKIYWTDRDNPIHEDPNARNSIQRMNLDGTNIETLVTGGPSVKEGIALDIAGGKMYWADWNIFTGGGKIQRANLNGTNVEDVVPELATAQGIALDLSRGKMYWTNSGVGKIQRANLDGSNIEDILTGLDAPHHLALDFSSGKIYWASWGAGKIQRANFDGSNLEDLVVGLSHPAGIALDGPNGKMYWTHWLANAQSGKIQRADLDGSNVEDLVTTASNFFVGIALGIPQIHSGLRFDPNMIADQTFTVGTDVSLNLPIATGGTEPYDYTLTPDPPAGLQFDARDRWIGGTPTTPMQTTPYTYTATDANGNTASRDFTLTIVDVSALENGLFAEVYRPGDTLTELPDFQTLTPVRTFTITNLDIPLRPCEQGFPGLGIDIIENFAIRFHGLLNIATAGTYNFALDVDDGAKLYINGSLIIDHDGLATLARGNPGRGSVTLPAGLHTVEVQYFQSPCSHLGLQWFWQPPGGTEQIVPADVLYLPDTPPGSWISFSPSMIANQTFTVGASVDLTLPIATGGSAPYTYTLFPIPEGLDFDAAAQRLTGTATTVGTTHATYAATDATGVSAALIFTITVEEDGLNLDVNADGKVDVLDLVWVAVSYGMRGDALPADVNADGVVNIPDLIAVAEGIDVGAALPAKVVEEVLFAAEAAAAEFEAGAGAPMMGFNTPRQVASGINAYGNVAAALADARTLGTGDVRLGKWLPLLEGLLQVLAEMSAVPETTALLPNYPNPFNPETWIPYHLAQDTAVVLTIYDVRGSVVRELSLGHQPAGVYESRGRAAYWDGRNQLGEKVASGLYFYTLTAGEFTATRKLLIAK